VNLSEELRVDSIKSFNLAAEKMTKNLDVQLAKFQEKIKKHPEKVKIVRHESYSGSSMGSFNILELSLLLLIVAIRKDIRLNVRKRST